MDVWLRELELALNLGIKSVLLFGVLGDARNDATASSASDPDGPMPSALWATRLEFGGDLTLVTDVCYKNHMLHMRLPSSRRGILVIARATVEQASASRKMNLTLLELTAFEDKLYSRYMKRSFHL